MTDDEAPARLTALASVVFAMNAATKAFIAIREHSPNAFSLPVFDRSGQPWWFLARLALCSAQDAAVILAALWLGLALVGRLRRAVLIGAHALATLALVLSVVNVQVFHEYQRFLDPSLLAMAQFGGHGYFEHYAPVWFLVPLVAGPPLALFVSRWFARTWRQDWLSVARALAKPWIALPLVAALWAVSVWTQSAVLNEAYAFFAASAHWTLVRDAIRPAEATGGDCGADLRDFQTGRAVARPADKKKNLVLVVWDGVPARALSVYGGLPEVTPELARLADRSTIFENFYSNASISAPSLLTVFGSVLNAPHAYVSHLSYPKYPLPHGPDWLRKHGWRGFFVGDDGWGDQLANFYLQHRFDVSMDSERVYDDAGKPRTPPSFHHPEESMAQVLSYLDEAKGAPFVIMHWTGAAHPPFWPGDGPVIDPQRFPASARGRSPENYANFLKALWRADRRLGELVRELERRGLADDTLIALTADHGHGWGEHGYWSYGEGLYDEIVHVPLVLIGTPARRIDGVGGHVDLWPTLANLVGAPQEPGWQGRDLLHSDGGRAYFSCIGQLGVRDGRWKLIWKLGGRQEKLYDLEADPQESKDISGQNPEVVARLRCQLVAWAREQRRHFEGRRGM